jgi:DNA-binding NarL/FixJ family response regulator
MAHVIRVVVIEPDAGLRQLLTMNLAIDGRFQVVGESAGGDDVLRLALARAPDAIVLDYLSVNPMDALPAIKQSLPEVTLVCCSTRNGHLQEQALQLGADFYLMKERTLSDDIVSALISANPDSEWA